MRACWRSSMRRPMAAARSLSFSSLDWTMVLTWKRKKWGGRGFWGGATPGRGGGGWGGAGSGVWGPGSGGGGGGVGAWGGGVGGGVGGGGVGTGGDWSQFQI